MQDIFIRKFWLQIIFSSRMVYMYFLIVVKQKRKQSDQEILYFYFNQFLVALWFIIYIISDPFHFKILIM
jgi:hypothetical protein